MSSTRADPILSKNAGWACEVTSRGSGSWSCRSVQLPGGSTRRKPQRQRVDHRDLRHTPAVRLLALGQPRMRDVASAAPKRFGQAAQLIGGSQLLRIASR